MLKKISTILNSPYSFNNEVSGIFKESILLGIIVSMIIYISLSFEDSVGLFDIFKILCFGIVTFIISFISILTLSRISPDKINENTWTVKREIISIIALLILISLSNSVLFFLFGYSKLDSKLVTESVLYTTKIGLLPIIIGIFIEQNRRLKKHLRSARIITNQLTRYSKLYEENFEYIFYDESEKRSLEFNTNELLFIKSAGNYVEFFIKRDESIKPILFRSSLKKVESQLLNSEHILKCHRTYLVNIVMISSAEGNSQGYKLKMKDCEYEIPVSRSYTKVLKNRINNIHLITNK